MEVLHFGMKKPTPLRDLLAGDPQWMAKLEACLTCGACSSGCPAAGIDDMDPRKAIRLVSLGLEEELIQSNWIFKCTGCDRCTYVCPMNIQIGAMITRARSLRDRASLPGKAQATCDLHRDKGNNMQIATDEWLDTVDWMKDELAESIPDLEVPIDKEGAEFFATINSKLPQYHPDDLQDVMKIFHVAKADWTMPSIWWEGTNYCMFSGDLKSWEQNLRNQVARVEELGCKTIAYTECGHGYFATLSGYKKFGIKPNFNVVHVVNLYAKWIREGRFKLDKSRNKQLVTLHDPCNATRKSVMNEFQDIIDDARYVLDHVCENWVEMTPNRENNYCCSGGGGGLISGLAQSRFQYGKVKVEQIDRTGAEKVCTPCVNCFDGIGELAKEYKRPWSSIHLWKLLANAIVLDGEEDGEEGEA